MKRAKIILSNINSIKIADIENAIKTVGLSSAIFQFIDDGTDVHLAIEEGYSITSVPVLMLLAYLGGNTDEV